MSILIACLAIACPALLLSCCLIPNRWANGRPAAMRRISVAFSMLALVSAIVTTFFVVRTGLISESVIQVSGLPLLNLGVYIDSLTVVMMLLISFIGWIITRYSVRYLDGEPTQGRFMRWISFTLGAVLLLVISNNLLMFTGAWILTSLGLHQLLTHYRDRPTARLAARKKFLISRVGDLLLIAALALTYWVFGSFEYGTIFAATASLEHDGSLVAIIGILFALGAMTKSAQFPMHSWLPDTMETPTPVSALMHAGIINAGGFLVIRLSPLLCMSPIALELLAGIGAVTAMFGAVVMLTQTSIKRSLAYSTIAQMGFMMLQCGLGAFSAALLHIVAHSLYKAHAFLNSGGVLESSARTQVQLPTASPKRSVVTLVVAGVLATVLSIAAAKGFSSFTTTKPAAAVMVLVLSIALTQLLWTAFKVPSRSVAIWGFFAAVLVCIGYFTAYAITDHILSASISHQLAPVSAWSTALMAVVALGFTGVFLLQTGIAHVSQARFFRDLYVLASNGFYIDVFAQKLVLRIWGNAS